MRQTLSVISSVAMAFFLTGCQNETFNANPDDTLISQNASFSNTSSSGLFATSMEVAANLDEKTVNPDTDINQVLIDQIVNDHKLEGKEYLTPEFVNKIIERTNYAKKVGLETFFKELGHSSYFSQQLGLAGDGKDISKSLNSAEFSNLSTDEQKILRSAILYQQEYFDYIAQNTTAKFQDGHLDNTAIGYGFYGGLIGLGLGASFGPAGAAIGFFAGAVIGVVISIFK